MADNAGQPTDDEGGRTFSLSGYWLRRRQKTERSKPRHCPPGGSGGICCIMRSQAVAPTTMDPNTANACCHAIEGTPSCATPSVNI
jgi:hypothetical protein